MELQATWFVLVAALLTGYAVLDGSDLGVGALYPVMGRNSGQQGMLRASLGPLRDGNELWLAAGFAALCIAFPPVGDLALSGFLLPLALVLGGLITRVAARVLAHRDGPRHVIWDAAFFVGSLLPAALLGLLLGNVVLGVPLDADGTWAGSLWSLLHPYALLTGLTGLALFMTHGAGWVAVRTEGQLRLKAIVGRSALHWLFLLLLTGLTVYTALEIPERLEHVLARPTGWLSLALVAAGIVGFRVCAKGWADGRAFLASSATIVGLMGIAATGNYPALVPARDTSEGAALTIANAAASDSTLTVMLIVAAVFVPLVLANTVYVQRRSGGKIGLPATSS